MNLKPFLEDEEKPKTQVAVMERTKTFLKLPQTKQEMILTAAITYEIMNQQEKLLKAKRDKEVRPIVEGAADAYGVEDQDGHLHLVMDDTEIVRIKKTSRTLNTVAAEQLLKEKGLYDSCVMQVISWELDEEKIIEAYNADKITAGELDSLFSENISWATKVNTDIEEVKSIKKLRKEIEKSKQGEMPEIEAS